MKTPRTLALIALLCAPLMAGWATPTLAEHHAGMAMPASGDKQAMATGTVKKLKPGKITIEHGPIANIGMPPMTMTFKAKDAALLKGVKVGDKVRFHVEDMDKSLTLTDLQVMH